jgi:hypothetical protein
MKKITLTQIERTYKNNGQHAEQVLRYTLTGEIMKADNREGCDLWDIQIKSSRATVCKGTDYNGHIDNDTAKQYAYVTADFTTAYLMNKNEYKKFVELFGTVTTESKKNGGATKTRLKEENQKMREWLECATL